MSGSEHARCVWLTREQRDVLSTIFNEGLIYAIVDAWDAAPADPTEAVDAAMTIYFDWRWGEAAGIGPRDAAKAVLRALGCAKDTAC